MDRWQQETLANIQICTTAGTVQRYLGNLPPIYPFDALEESNGDQGPSCDLCGGDRQSCATISQASSLLATANLAAPCQSALSEEQSLQLVDARTQGKAGSCTISRGNQHDNGS